jgi:hypothetical protein
MFPMALAVVTAMTFIAAVDLYHGHPLSLAEAQHVFEFIGVVLLGSVARAEGGLVLTRRTLGLA